MMKNRRFATVAVVVSMVLTLSVAADSNKAKGEQAREGADDRVEPDLVAEEERDGGEDAGERGGDAAAAADGDPEQRDCGDLKERAVVLRGGP